MLDQLIEYDKELFLYLNNLGSESWDSLWLAITHEFTFAPSYAILLFYPSPIQSSRGTFLSLDIFSTTALLKFFFFFFLVFLLLSTFTFWVARKGTHQLHQLLEFEDKIGSRMQ